MQHKKHPPYSKKLRELIEQGECHAKLITIWIGELAWNPGKRFAALGFYTDLILPAYECPTSYSWPVKDLATAIINTGGDCTDEYVSDLAYSLFVDGASSVLYVIPEHQTCEIINFKRTFK